jgi:hypothetical protein
MSVKYTKHFLKKLESLLATLEYTIRYEKGNFQSGYCIVENKKIAVINKFFDVEARINSLLDILATVQVDPDTLDEKEAKLYLDLRKDDYLSTSESEAPSN